MNDFSNISKSNDGVVSGNSLAKERLKKIAKSQRLVLFFILMYFPMIFMILALAVSGWSGRLILILCLFPFAYIIFSYVHIILLANTVYGAGMAAICGIFFWFFPPLGFILLFVVNGRASKLLKNEGYKVGLLGVAPNAFKEVE